MLRSQARSILTNTTRAQMFSTSARLANAAPQQAAPQVVVKPKRKVGAFRGGLLGFLLGATITGYGSYYYLFDEYRAANSVVLTDVMQLQDSIRILENHVSDLEKKLNSK